MPEKERSQGELQILVLRHWKLIFTEIGKYVKEAGWWAYGKVK